MKIKVNRLFIQFIISIALPATGLHSSYAQSLLAKDSIKVAIEPDYNKVSGAHRLFFGESYRKLWATPVNIKIFHLNTEKGGLKIEQRGGGMQTKSLRLKDSNGQEWVLRTVQKYPEAVLPQGLRETLAKDIVQDQISAEHPFAFLVVPPMAQALGVPHANPQVVYVPDDPAFGKYRKDFANQVFLFEEREPLDADKTDNTDKAQKKLQEDNDNKVDQKLVLRARLLDMILGDWDRHEDQWRWERTGDKDNILYKPVPRDRDQVFYSTSGVLPWLFSRHLMLSKLQNYGDHIRSINRWNLNARNFDRYFLTDLSEDDWKEEIAIVQKTLTDQLIRSSLKKMPANIYNICGADLERKLIARRNVLDKQALGYYRFISATVSITASDKREYIKVQHEADGKLAVTVNKLKKDDTKGKVTYSRVFDPKVTKEIRVYGFAGKDQFAVTGDKRSPIQVRLIGGDDEDTFTVDSNLNNRNHILIYDRADQPNHLPSSRQAKIRTSTDTVVNSYQSKKFKYDFIQPLILGSYSKDYGVEFIGDIIFEKHGFRSDPYSSRKSLMITYGFGTQSLMLGYNGDFKKLVGNNDLVVNALSKGPNFTSNFFGIGNNSQFVNRDHQKIRYYHNVYDYQSADVRLKHTYGNWVASAGPAVQFYKGDEDDNLNKFLNVYNQAHQDERVYNSQIFGGAIAQLTLDTRDKSVVPHSGIYWNTTLTGMKGFNSISHDYGQVQTEFSFHLTPKTDSVFIVADRIGGGTTIGNAAFYQQLKLGGADNLRGFYRWRFTGRTMAFNNLEVRWRLFDFDSYILPGTLGLIGFNDIGRVWTPGEKSNTWHDGYGGGFYFLPAQLFIVQTVIGVSKEGVYPYISAGFRF